MQIRWDWMRQVIDERTSGGATGMLVRYHRGKNADRNSERLTQP
jgi:hypothetical protein